MSYMEIQEALWISTKISRANTPKQERGGKLWREVTPSRRTKANQEPFSFPGVLRMTRKRCMLSWHMRKKAAY